jgi:4-cresol dehydrogenase (hydroxylating)
MIGLKMINLNKAIKAWTQCLSSQHILTELIQLQKCQTATFINTSQIIAILRPANTEQIQECLEIANQYHIPVYPISRGRNTGYGSKVPHLTIVYFSI